NMKDFRMSETYEPMTFLEEGDNLPEDVTYVDGSYVKVNMFGNEPIIEFEYQEDVEMYTRTQDEEESDEIESEKPIEIANVLIVEAAHEDIDEEGRRAIDIDTGGKGYLLQKGKAQEIEWENQDGRIVPVQDAEVIPFVPGKTWI